MIVRPQGITSLRPFFCFEGKVGEIFRIQNGFKQGAETVIIDARNTGLTLGQANTIMERAAGKYGGTLLGHVEIWTIEGIIKR